MQLLHDRIEFIPLGLFQLDLNFMYGVSIPRKCDELFAFHSILFQLIGAVCTYLIILIQFDLAQKAAGKPTIATNTTIP